MNRKNVLNEADLEQITGGAGSLPGLDDPAGTGESKETEKTKQIETTNADVIARQQ